LVNKCHNTSQGKHLLDRLQKTNQGVHCASCDYVSFFSAHKRPSPFLASANVHIGHRKLATSEHAGTSTNRRRHTDVDVVKNRICRNRDQRRRHAETSYRTSCSGKCRRPCRHHARAGASPAKPHQFASTCEHRRTMPAAAMSLWLVPLVRQCLAS